MFHLASKCFGKCKKQDLSHFFNSAQGKKASLAIEEYLTRDEFVDKLLNSGETIDTSIRGAHRDGHAAQKARGTRRLRI